MFLWVIKRDLLLAMRQRADVLTTLFFFVIVVSLFPLGVGPEINMLRAMADGTLEQMLLSPQPLSLLVLGKALAHWLVTGVPLALIAPILGVQFDLPIDALLVLTASLLLGTPVLSLIGAIGAALTLGLRGGGVLVSLLVLPLYIPVLIFGAGAVEASSVGLGASAHLSLLGAFLLLSLVFAPSAAAAALRISLE